MAYQPSRCSLNDAIPLFYCFLLWHIRDHIRDVQVGYAFKDEVALVEVVHKVGS